MWDERLVSPRDVLLHLMFRPLPTIDWETTQRGTAPVYKKPGSVRPAGRMEPLAGCSQTGLHLSTGSLPVAGGYVQRFPAARVIPAVEEGANVSVFPAPSSSLLDLIPATTTSARLHTHVFLAA